MFSKSVVPDSDSDIIPEIVEFWKVGKPAGFLDLWALGESVEVVEPGELVEVLGLVEVVGLLELEELGETARSALLQDYGLGVPGGFSSP